MTSVSFQGERGAYSEAAAKSFFDDNIQTIPLPTFSDILQNTSKDISEYAILPVENSLEGSVGESYDLLYSTDLNVTGETYQKIEHCLIGIGKLEEVDTVYSHPQALGQCRNFIEKYKMKTLKKLIEKQYCLDKIHGLIYLIFLAFSINPDLIRY